MWALSFQTSFIIFPVSIKYTWNFLWFFFTWMESYWMYSQATHVFTNNVSLRFTSPTALNSLLLMAMFLFHHINITYASNSFPYWWPFRLISIFFFFLQKAVLWYRLLSTSLTAHRQGFLRSRPQVWWDWKSGLPDWSSFRNVKLSLVVLAKR